MLNSAAGSFFANLHLSIKRRYESPITTASLEGVTVDTSVKSILSTSLMIVLLWL